MLHFIQIYFTNSHHCEIYLTAMLPKLECVGMTRPITWLLVPSHWRRQVISSMLSNMQRDLNSASWSTRHVFKYIIHLITEKLYTIQTYFTIPETDWTQKALTIESGWCRIWRHLTCNHNTHSLPVDQRNGFYVERLIIHVCLYEQTDIPRLMTLWPWLPAHAIRGILTYLSN